MSRKWIKLREKTDFEAFEGRKRMLTTGMKGYLWMYKTNVLKTYFGE